MPQSTLIHDIATDLLDVLPNPVLVKDAETRYVWVNKAFETLFDVHRDDLFGQLDSDVFPNRQVAQCNGGDLRVLATGELDEAQEVVIDPLRGDRETITRKIRQTASNGEHYLLGVMHDITEVTTANRKLTASAVKLEQQAALLKKMANTDSLTGCLNRRALHADADASLASKSADSALLVLDIDHFKLINDRYGHSTGDQALLHFVECTKSMLRDEDILGRIGGEEFAVLLPDVSLTAAETIATRICKHVKETPLVLDGNTISMTVSIGLKHQAKSSDYSVDDMLRQADRVLYKAKTAGRDRFVSAH